MAAAKVSEMDPAEAWSVLESEPDAMLVDVRTRPEWAFVGTPDLTGIGKQVILTEWRQFPGMNVNQAFVPALLDQVGTPPKKIFFLCRSGARSMEAAMQTAAELGETTECINVREGFEGDLDQQGHRAHLNGWKARGLAWRQS
ncbi:rhodanese-like domain-containing protein [Paroceanicella profunda]|uniref:Rhodanese-like domain-containing protein n=2 Tax=Paroceanicella profunda TaxID=2579971 RepID=A0A5B8G3W6_9RHOB|nr:rhodanese-like domain-containing protein [Paroceanicella profunda]